MLEHNELTQDEQQYPELTRQLQETYSIKQADLQSLQRIQARLEHPQLLSIQQSIQPENRAGQFTHPRVAGRSNAWSLRIGVLAALLLIVFLIGGVFLATPISKNVASFLGGPGQDQPSISQISMKSAMIGWGEGTLGGTNNGQAVLARTLDGGKTWQTVTLPTPYTNIITSFFLDTTTAWVIPESTSNSHSETPLLHTLDGGKTWQSFKVPGYTRDITFVDKQYGWAKNAITGTTTPLQIVQTTDGGKTWQKMSVSQASGTDLTSGPIGFFEDTTFLNHQLGWSIGASTYTTNKMTPARLYRTQDGGESWQLQQLPQLDEGSITLPSDINSGRTETISPPHFSDAQHGSLIVSVNNFTRKQSKIDIYVYSTSDSGQSWQLVGNKISNVLPDAFLNQRNISFIDTTHFIFAYGGVVTIYELAGGQWQEKYRESLGGVSDGMTVDFLDGHTGWMTLNKETIKGKDTTQWILTSFIYKTSDGGKSWQKIQQSNSITPKSLS